MMKNPAAIGAFLTNVTPVKAGVQKKYQELDSRLRGNDGTTAG
jgi:hypothetical protein